MTAAEQAGPGRGESRAVIAFGANLGERRATLEAAIDELGGTAGIRLLAVSPSYETVAITDAGADAAAPRYLNGVVLVATTLEPLELLDVLQTLEHAHGRVRTEHWGPRTLDLDLIDVDGMILAGERLTLPHPRAAERAFVLQPWLDVEPDAELPGFGPIAALRRAAKDEMTPVGDEIGVRP
ncbi:2-amino-4-hydroxy-6-hydroxymethyldihydropteridine diphosphokinase [Agromyces archimandritae]|uniref:2-amino-4-hydroxy-6-hydroxymethyldihydropteridine diphosphokinase n=1 Tax=Agromyces archimandritae TaxID=2781962 RepID=A0A975FN78_9MICO|nr:2-amino-4-hydroxy-6-hydroxymethyldihydropteridine diphosphokinase [Agromyces archimandritae]QTX05568.1 2-amino-4-hydroxy-6-hydroxymethyldihydropteridine diphosphokinase [Agromyces archimandritae]